MGGALILLLGLGALLLLSKAEKKGPTYPGQEPGVTPPQEAALIVGIGGRWVYKPEARPILLQALKTKSIRTSELDPLMSIMTEEGRIVDPNVSAYTAAKLLHEGGFNIWVTPTLMNPYPEERILYATPNPDMVAATGGDVNPPEGLEVALLVSFADPWPADAPVSPADVPPPPPPPPVPPAPPGA